MIYKKNLRQTQRKFTATFIRKIYRWYDLKITDIGLRNWGLSIIGIVQNFFEIIDYRYRFSTKRFIVPITAHK